MKMILSGVALSMATMAGMAHASSGMINFTGAVNQATCVVKPGANATGTDNNILVQLHTVPLRELGVGGSIGSVKQQFELEVVCSAGMTGLATVNMTFDPLNGTGSGMDPYDRRLLQLSNPTAPATAKGVGLGLFDMANQIVRLDANGVISAPLTAGAVGEATATLAMQASYLSNGEARLPGRGDAVLPFTLTYE